MARPLLPIWKEFETTVPADETKRKPDVECRHCRREIRSARPKQLRGHALKCQLMPIGARMKVGYQPTGNEVKVQAEEFQPTRNEVQEEEEEGEEEEDEEEEEEEEEDSSDHYSNGEEEETEAVTVTTMEHRPLTAPVATIASAPVPTPAPTTAISTAPPLAPAPVPVSASVPTPVQTQRALGKRPRVEEDKLEGVLKGIRNAMDGLLQVKRQELLLRREELGFQREAMTSKLEYKRQLREEERRERIELREAERQERLEMARIENEKSMTFIKAVMEASAHQRR